MEDVTKIKDEFYANCKDVTLETIGDYLNGLMAKSINYDTIVYAMGAGLLACVNAMDKHPKGGLSGFQAGCVMWEFINKFMYPSNECGMRLLDFDKLLYPQYYDSFEKYLTKTQWRLIQAMAKKNIEEENQKYKDYIIEMGKYPAILNAFEEEANLFSLEHPEVPSYKDNPKYYEDIQSGSEELWDLYYKKKEMGVPFKPREPYFISCSKSVLVHWKSIVDGELPFGFKIKED